jgi:hypothetical protein
LRAKTVKETIKTVKKLFLVGNPQGRNVKSKEQGKFNYLGGQSPQMISLGI